MGNFIFCAVFIPALNVINALVYTKTHVGIQKVSSGDLISTESAAKITILATAITLRGYMSKTDRNGNNFEKKHVPGRLQRHLMSV